MPSSVYVQEYILLLKNNKLDTEFIGFGSKYIIIVFLNFVEFNLRNELTGALKLRNIFHKK
jgi:hypothetical protein